MDRSSSGAVAIDEPVELRRPQGADGPLVHELIGRCPPLEHNSLYCNLLQCTHFAETCVVAWQAERPVGFVSAYLIPRQPEALFVWQIAVGPETRKRGLGGRMLLHIMDRPVCAGVQYLKTTITGSNEPSWSLFEALARRFGAPLEQHPLFDSVTHLSGTAESEILVTIGPLGRCP